MLEAGCARWVGTLALAGPLGSDLGGADPRPRLAVASAAAERVGKLLLEAGIGPDVPVLSIAPGSVWGNGSCPGGGNGKGLEFVYVLAREDGKPWFSFPSSPAPDQSGSYGGVGAGADCLYAYAKHPGYRFVVCDYKHNNWSWDCSYSFQIEKKSVDCLDPCVRKGNQSQCSTP